MQWLSIGIGMSCNNAVQETKASMKALAIVTVLNGIVNKNLQLDSLLNNYVYFGKYILKNNEKIRNNFIDAILCKLGLWAYFTSLFY